MREFKFTSSRWPSNIPSFKAPSEEVKEMERNLAKEFSSKKFVRKIALILIKLKAIK